MPPKRITLLGNPLFRERDRALGIHWVRVGRPGGSYTASYTLNSGWNHRVHAHGAQARTSPENAGPGRGTRLAIESNAFTRVLEELGQDLPRPKAICVVSAHWVTRGSQVLAAEWPPEYYAPILTASPPRNRKTKPCILTKASNSAAFPCAPPCFNQPPPLIPRFPGLVYAVVCAVFDGK
jgi:hypothetical protein